MGNSESSRLKAYAAGLGVELNDAQADMILSHLGLVLEKNKVLNLTAIEDRDRALVLHAVDSLTLAPLLEGCSSPEGRYLDIGTGGGYPGIPLAIATGLRGTLIDSVSKKIDACKAFVEELGLEEQLELLSLRAEELAKERAAAYEAVVARAVAPIAVLIEYAAPLLDTGGSLIISKAPLQEDEFQQGERAAGLCGMENVSRETLELPEGLGARELLIYKKSGVPSVTLPRRPGMAVKRPLGSK